MDCLFCKVVARAIPADVVLENDDALAFRDIRPVAPTHLLVVPKKHLRGIHEATAGDAGSLGAVMLLARDAAEKAGLAEAGYRLVINNGEHAGQSVFHLHVHVLGGRHLGWPPG